MRKEKAKWESQKLCNAGKDSSAVWRNVKSWLSWGNRGPPSKLIENGNVITKPKELAKAMNNHFVTKVKQLKSKVPTSLEDPCSKMRDMMKERKCTFPFH